MSGVLIPIPPEAAAPILAQAFANDPAIAFFTQPRPKGGDALRERLIEWISQRHAHMGQPIWGWKLSGRILGCALVEEGADPMRQGWATLRMMPAAFGLPIETLRRMDRYHKCSRKGLPQGVTHFLTMIGMADSARGRGEGARFLAALHTQSGPSSHWALDTENPDTLTFYGRAGYSFYARATVGELTVLKLHRQSGR